MGSVKPAQLAVSDSSLLRAERFPWPAPPGYEFVRGKVLSGDADCVVMLREGHIARGRLFSFAREQGWLTYLPEQVAEPVVVEFRDLVAFQFLRPVALRREAVGSDFAATEPLRFSIGFADGESFSGVSVGCVESEWGIFLYVPSADHGVMRTFVPSQAVVSMSMDALGDAAESGPGGDAISSANLTDMLRTQKLVRPAAVAGVSGGRESADVTRSIVRTLAERGIPAKPDAAGGDAVVLRVALERARIPAVISGRVAAEIARLFRVVPLCEHEGALVLAMANHRDRAVLDKLAAITRGRVYPVSAPDDEITAALGRLYPEGGVVTHVAGVTSGETSARGSGIGDSEVLELISRLYAESASLETTEQQVVGLDSALVKLVNRIILDAVRQKASDIHIEANFAPKTTRVRFRRDGVLHKYVELPSQFRNAVVSRIKIMSQLDITERRKPQDGKIDFSRFGPAKVELRVATVPTTDGLEDVVMRVLVAATPVPLRELGLEGDTLAAIERMITKPHGLFLVCGPTGSGKTTTLHSLLSFLNTEDRKIWTAEDPIEITQPDLRQVQVNAKIGWTFAAAMRSFMRADPDVIMVGEMRDPETAKIGIEASLTGHFVLSTLHTNSAPESIVRLLDLGMDPFNFADALVGVMGARLARRLCPDCREPYDATDEELGELAAQYRGDSQSATALLVDAWRARHGADGGTISLCRARGCPGCGGTGYLGRVGLYELLVADAEIKRLVQTRASVADVKAAARAGGMRTLRQDGIEKVLQGITDIHQVNAVSG